MSDEQPKTRIEYDTLTTEQRNPKSMHLDEMSTEEIVRLINDEDRQVPDAVASEIPNIVKAVHAVVRALRAGGRVLYVGAGTSGRIGLLDALEWPPTFGVDPATIRAVVAGGTQAAIDVSTPSEDDADAGAAEMVALRVGTNDVVVGIAASGVTPFVLSALAEAKRRGAAVVGISNVAGSPLSTSADIGITPVVGPEVLTGSTRMKAGTAQKMVLNMISTAAMVRLGKVYSNLMADMPARNRKLVSRARRMVAQAAGIDAETSEHLLDEAGGSAKVAIVMAVGKVDRMTAESALERAGGHVREAINQTRKPDARRR
jgi:N-acetylmuramic acid 6-phosphate etherase